MQDRFEAIRQALDAVGQSHVLCHWGSLSSKQRAGLLTQIEEIDLGMIARLAAQTTDEAKVDFTTLEPAEFRAIGDPTLPSFRAAGEELLRAGRVAAFTVAGGQGTRLGWRGPKGSYPATVVTGKPLFRVFAEQIAAAEKRYGRVIPWYIMTSPINDQETRAFFQDNNWFGRSPRDTLLFPQGTMPSITLDGKLMLETNCTLAVNPDGHGGSLRALAASGAVEDMKARGIEQISYFQVDNPLVKVIDPAFLGLHATAADSSGEMSSKMVRKRDAAEKVGVFCHHAGKTMVLEYSDLPKSLAEATDASGMLRFAAGSVAIHAISVAFVDRLTQGDFALPFHRAKKKVPYYCDKSASTIEPTEPNAIKFEAFIFDALVLTAKSLLLETSRVEEFAPIKNSTGEDSPSSSHQTQSNRNGAWLERFGTQIPRRANGDVDARIEISAATALFEDDLATLAAAGQLPKRIAVDSEAVV
ncbi:MAG: UDPGP type 1 family protein [Phycisphaerales bacterium]|nr:UDPGP type 1 family protein [Phycisphaerales bacterium]